MTQGVRIGRVPGRDAPAPKRPGAQPPAVEARLLALQRTIGNAAVSRAVGGQRLLQRVSMKPALKKALRAARGWGEDDVDDESLKDFCDKCRSEAQAKLIANAVTYETWSDCLADKTPGSIPATSEDLLELVEQEKVRRKNLALQAAVSRPETKEPEFDRARYLDQGVPSTDLAGLLLGANLVFAQLAGPDRRLLLEADADLLAARGSGKAAARTALQGKVQELRLEATRRAEAAERTEQRQARAVAATERMRATTGNPLGNALVERVWRKAVDSYVTQNANVTVDGEHEPAAIRVAVESWRRMRNRGNPSGVTNLHVPGGGQFIQDKGPKDIQRGASAREARSYQADFISNWPGLVVNVHVDATGPLPA
jgi:hypothetical protein